MQSMKMETCYMAEHCRERCVFTWNYSNLGRRIAVKLAIDMSIE